MCLLIWRWRAPVNAFQRIMTITPLCRHWQTHCSLWCQTLPSRRKDGTILPSYEALHKFNTHSIDCHIRAAYFNVRSIQYSLLDAINIYTLVTYLLCKNTGFPNRALHIFIICTLTAVLGVPSPSIMLMVSWVDSMVDFLCYDDDHSTRSLNVWFMTMRKDSLNLKLLHLMPQFMFLMFFYHIRAMIMLISMKLL